MLRHSNIARMNPFNSIMSASPPSRKAFITRNTKETKIQLSLSLDGGPLDLLELNPEFDSSSIPAQDEDTHASQITATQHIWIWTGVGFLDHMLHALAKHAGWSLRLRSKGDLLSRINPRFFLETGLNYTNSPSLQSTTTIRQKTLSLP